MIAEKIYNSTVINHDNLISIAIFVDVRDSIPIYLYSERQNGTNKWNLMMYDYGTPYIVFGRYQQMLVKPEFEIQYHTNHPAMILLRKSP